MSTGQQQRRPAQKIVARWRCTPLIKIWQHITTVSFASAFFISSQGSLNTPMNGSKLVLSLTQILKISFFTEKCVFSTFPKKCFLGSFSWMGRIDTVHREKQQYSNGCERGFTNFFQTWICESLSILTLKVNVGVIMECLPQALTHIKVLCVPAAATTGNLPRGWGV